MRTDSVNLSDSEVVNKKYKVERISPIIAMPPLGTKPLVVENKTNNKEQDKEPQFEDLFKESLRKLGLEQTFEQELEQKRSFRR